MATTVAELVAKLTMNSEEFKRGVDDAGRAGDKLTTGFKNVGVSAAAVGTAIAAAGVALAAFARQSLSAFESLADTTRDLAFVAGATAKEVSGLIDVLDDYGIEAGTVQRAMVFLSRAVQEGSPALERLGISIRTNSGHLKTAHDLFFEVIEALKNMRNETERNWIAQELFSRGWTAMVPIIEKYGGALREAAAASKLTMSDDDIKRAQEYKLAVAELGDQFERFKLIVARGIVAPITVVVKWVANVVDFAAALMSPHTGVTIDPAERERLLEQMDPTGRMRAQLPQGSMASDVGAWRMGAAGAPVTAPRPVEGPTKGELEAKKKLEEQNKKLADAEAARILYLAGIEIKAMEQLEKERAEFLKWDTDQVKEQLDIRLAAEKDNADIIAAYLEKQRETISDAEYAALQEAIRRRQEARDTELQSYVDQARFEEQVNKEAWAAVDAYYKTQIENTAKMRAEFDGLFTGVETAFSGMLQGILQGTQTIEEAFRRMGQNILATLLNDVIQRGLKAVQDALWDAMSPLLQETGGTSFWGSLVEAFASGAGSSAGATASVGSYAAGGVVTRPTFAMLGEGGESEAIVPLSRAGEFGFGGGAGVTQNIIVNAGVPETVRREINALRPELRRDAVDALLEARNRGGGVAKSFGERQK